MPLELSAHCHHSTTDVHQLFSSSFKVTPSKVKDCQDFKEILQGQKQRLKQMKMKSKNNFTWNKDNAGSKQKNIIIIVNTVR